MKTYKELMESLQATVDANKTPVSESFNDEMGPREIENLTYFFRQLSSAFQKNREEVIKRIEHELNKYGFTLGPVDVAGLADEDEELNFFPLVFATKEPLKNTYISLVFDDLASGQQFDLRPDGGALNVRVDAAINVIDREEFEQLFAEADTGDVEEGDDGAVDFSADTQVYLNNPARVE